MEGYCVLLLILKITALIKVMSLLFLVVVIQQRHGNY